MGSGQSFRSITTHNVLVSHHRLGGTWYEICRLNNDLQPDDAFNVTFDFKPNAKGDLSIVITWNTKELQQQQSQRGSKVVEKHKDVVGGTNGFAKRLNSLGTKYILYTGNDGIPTDFWILSVRNRRGVGIKYDPYEYAIIGEPSRKYMWILSRDVKVDYQVFAELLTSVRHVYGYDLNEISYTIHNETH